MGVAGLWDIIRSSGKTRSLTHLAVVDGFEANPDGKRGFRIGIDASIWFFHATYGKEGENPELRTLFFRCSRLMTMPFLPLFVFDGPKRPSVKRGKRIGGKAHWLTDGMKNLIEAFGFEWRTAPGEAEAELAYLNHIGVIDAILSDDVDNFLFGAKIVIRNPSSTLSGNRAHPIKNSAGRDDGQHVVIYDATDIRKSDIGLTRGGFILIGLLSGGDYHQAGLARCGPNIAHGLAKCGFGDTLLKASQTLSRDELEVFLSNWRTELRNELRTNSQGHMGRKSPSLAKSVPDDFPNIDILLSYTNPITSETERKKNISVNWDREPDLGKVANMCELYFEWGVRPTIIKRFRTVLWPPAVLRILRRAALDRDKRASNVSAPEPPSTPRKNGRERPMPIGTPSKMITRHFSSMKLDSPGKRGESDSDEEEERLIVKIHSSRTHASTDGLLEYRLEVAPAQLVRLTEAGIKDIRPASNDSDADEDFDEEDGESDETSSKRKVKKSPPDPTSHLRIWMPASMVQLVEPHLVEEYEGMKQKKANKKNGKGRSTAIQRQRTKQKIAAVLEEEKEEEPPHEIIRSSTQTAKNLKQNSKFTKSVTTDVVLSNNPTKKTIISKTSEPPRGASGGSSKPRRKPSPIPFVLSDESDTESILSSRIAPLPSGSNTNPPAWRNSSILSLSESDDELPDNASLRKPALEPFPVSFTDSDSSPTLRFNKPGQKKLHRDSDSDFDQNRIEKLPRKHLHQLSPRSRRTISPGKTAKDTKIQSRPDSPSPLRSRAHMSKLSAVAKTTSRAVAIDISSDSDADVPTTSKLKLPPLLLARARNKQVSGYVGKETKSIVSKHAHKNEDIIDLT